jgi:hypothetical protein
MLIFFKKYLTGLRRFPYYARMNTPEMEKYDEKIIRRELEKCAADAVYYIDNYGTIEDATHGLIPFHLWDGQKKYIRDIHNNNISACLKGRQIGVTWLVIHYCIWFCAFFAHKFVAIISKDEALANEMIRKGYLAYDNLPTWLKHKTKGRPVDKIIFAEFEKDSKGNRKLSGNQSQIKAYPNIKTALTGESPHIIVFDDFAKIWELNRMMPSVLGSRAQTRAKMIFEGSAYQPFGIGQAAKEICDNAQEKKGRWHDAHFTFLGWQTDPRRDEKWEEEERRRLGSFFRQEHPSNPQEAWIAGGNGYFNTQLLMKRIEDLQLSPVHPRRGSLMVNMGLPEGEGRYDFVDSEKGNLYVWKFPAADHTYSMGGDPAVGGSNPDDSVAYVFDDKTKEYVCKIKGKLNSEQFAYLEADVAAWYNMAFIGNEANKGDTVNKYLVNPVLCNYPYVYVRTTIDKFPNDVIDKLGWYSTAQTKRWIYANFNRYWEADLLGIYDIELLYQMQNIMVLDNDRVGTEGKVPDDHPDAACITLEMHEQRPAVIEKSAEQVEMEYKRKQALDQVAALRRMGKLGFIVGYEEEQFSILRSGEHYYA